MFLLTKFSEQKLLSSSDMAVTPAEKKLLELRVFEINPMFMI